MSLLFAATYPDAASALVLYGPRRPASVRPPGIQVGRRQRSGGSARDALEQDWGQGAMLELFVPQRRRRPPPYGRSGGTFQRASASPAMARGGDRSLVSRSTSGTSSPRSAVPTLILHRTGDRIAPVQGARFMAERIPGARYVEFDETRSPARSAATWTPTWTRSRSSSTGEKHAPANRPRPRHGDVHRHRRLDATRRRCRATARWRELIQAPRRAHPAPARALPRARGQDLW